MDLFLIITSLFALSTLFSYINSRWIKLPSVIGVMILSIITVVLTLITSSIFPKASQFISNLSNSVEFSESLLDVMLGFLLFASALHFDIDKLKESLKSVLIISSVGVLISALLFAGTIYVFSSAIGFAMPFAYCLVFGALAAPTDAIAVGALLKNSKMPKKLETIISGESLFNDGVGIVLFITFLSLIEHPEKTFSLVETLKLFSIEVFGGCILGVIMGLIAKKLMRSVADFHTIVLISITLVMGISVIGSSFHVSVPLAVVLAGLILSKKSTEEEVNQRNREFLHRIWGFIDQLMNTLLFVMIGLQMVSMTFEKTYVFIGLAGILILLVARFISLYIPFIFVKRKLNLKFSSVYILTWGGLRGGISIALAMSIPPSIYREAILTGAFFIVVFSVVFQGLTLNKVVDKLLEA